MFRNPDDGTPEDVPRHECAIHGYRADDYPCPDCDLLAEDEGVVRAFAAELGAGELGSAQTLNELMLALERALSRVRERQDEQKGRDLAARFDTGVTR